MQPASIPRRVGAYAIDLVVAYAIIFLIGTIGALALFSGLESMTQQRLAAAVLVLSAVMSLAGLAWAIVYTLMQGGAGSIGQRLVGIRLRDIESGASIGFWRALLRNLIWGLAGSIVVGYFTPLFDSSGRRQGWHDKVANTVVVDRADVPGGAGARGGAAVSVAPPAKADAPHSGLPVAVPSPGSTPPAPTFVPPPPPPPAATAATPPPAAAVPTPTAPSAPDVAQPAPASPVADAVIASVPGITIDPAEIPDAATPAQAPAESPAVAPAAETPVLAASAPVSTPTADIDIDETRAAPARARAVVVLVWDDGTRTAVYTRTHFGRNPAGGDGLVVSAVRDETLSLSKTHFEIGSGAGGAYVADLHSTNGTVLVRDGARAKLVAGVQTSVFDGDVLEFGDRRATIGGGA